MRLFISLFFVFVSSFIYPQVFDKQYNFASPVDIPIRLSGNFAELRPNHFHSGIDIKTQQRIGLNIYSIEEGYISRIKVSPYGYGKVVYITHPKIGLVSVYAHLEDFTDEIKSYVNEVQRKKQSFSIDLYLQPEKFKIEKGQHFSYSGNTGGSGGPHLHFEIRDEITEATLNPMFFGFDIKDDIPPTIYSLCVYPIGHGSTVNNSYNEKEFRVYGGNGKYYVKNNINVSGTVGFAIRTNDFVNNSHNKCGLYSLQLFVNDELYFHHQLDSFHFAESRYINSHIDYGKYKEAKIRYQKMFISPNNPLSTYKFEKDFGNVTFGDAGNHEVKIITVDAYHNVSELSLNVYGNTNNKPNQNHNDYMMAMAYNKENYIIKDDFRLIIYPNSLYEHLYFTYERVENPFNNFSVIHEVADKKIPIHNSYVLSIKADSLAENLRKKALIAGLSDRNKPYSVGGEWINGFISTRTRHFGRFFVEIDTVPPKIRPYRFNIKNANFRNKTKISFIIGDNLSGIKSIDGFIDNEWVVFDYDAKNDIITHYFKETANEEAQKRKLVLKIKDEKENESILSFDFYR